MAFRAFGDTSVSRRSLFRSAGLAGAGVGLSMLPGASALLARDAAEKVPAVARMVKGATQFMNGE